MGRSGRRSPTSGPSAARSGDPLADPQVVLGCHLVQLGAGLQAQAEPDRADARRASCGTSATAGRTTRRFSTDDAYRALDSAERLLKAVAAPQAAEVERQRKDLMRIRYEEDAKREVRKAATAPVEGQPQAGSKPWREVVTPHADVASGRYQQAEFAADLAQVHRGEGSDEYREPEGLLPTDLRHRGHPAAARGRAPAPRGHRRRSRRRAADELRRRQDPLDARPLSPLLGRRHRRPPGDRADPQGSGRIPAAQGEARRLRGDGALGGRCAQDARRDTHPHDVGRPGVAARREEGLRPRRRGRQARRQPGLRRAAATPLEGGSVPHPHRRVGGLRPPALRRGRPARADLRLQPHLRPVADRGGPGGGQGPGRGDDPAVRHRGRRGRRDAQALVRLENTFRRTAGRVGAGERRGELRDRPSASVRADRAIEGPAARRRRQGLLELLPREPAGVPAGLRGRGLRAPPSRRLPGPPRAVRPPLRRLVDARPLPAHPRRAAPHGRGHPGPVGAPGREPADHAGSRAARCRRRSRTS